MSNSEAEHTVPLSELIELLDEAREEVASINADTQPRVETMRSQGMREEAIHADPDVSFRLGQITLGVKWLKSLEAFVTAHGSDFDGELEKITTIK